MDDANRASFIMKSKFLKSDTVRSDQQKGVPPPALEKPYFGEKVIDLPSYREAELVKPDIREIIAGRKSLREYKDEPLNMSQLSWLLWATQGVHGLFKNGIATRRTVPSAGARHAFETYVFVFDVTGLQKGLYRYLALEHKLGLVKRGDDLAGPLVEACLGQAFVGKAAATFAWTVIPYR
ncbi:MAG: SagB/ThcOx family dehydrogenase, partial [Firmicutes bacterium]|nr:SagB/ThcOx family dehydrogenase [Bacillota bacterium]